MPDFQIKRRSRLPAEHLGLARALRNQVLQDEMEWKPEIVALVRTVQLRFKRKGTLRHDQCLDLVRRWKRMPSPYRLAFDSKEVRKGVLQIDEVTVASSTLLSMDWEDGAEEPGICVVGNRLLTDGFARFESVPLCSISLHALARYWERTGHRTHEPLLRDLIPLVHAFEDNVDNVPTSSGQWLGSIARCHSGKRYFDLRAVRTYISDVGYSQPRRPQLPGSVLGVTDQQPGYETTRLQLQRSDWTLLQ